jgi:hypothetical protein
MEYDEVAAASAECVNALLVGATVAASVTYQAVVTPPTWFPKPGTVRQQLAWAFSSLNAASFFFAIACIVIGALMLLPKPHKLQYRVQAESRLRWLLWATLCLLAAVLAEAGAVAVVLYAGWKFEDVQDSMFTARWWWFGILLVGVFVIFYAFRWWSTFKVAHQSLHLPRWFFLWSTERTNFSRLCFIVCITKHVKAGRSGGKAGQSSACP